MHEGDLRTKMSPQARSMHWDRPGDMVLNVLLFARRLKANGLSVTLGRTLGAIRGLKLIRMEEKEETYVLLSAHFVSRPEDLPIFDEAFEAFWRLKASGDSMGPAGQVGTPGRLPLALSAEQAGAEGRKDEPRAPAYSPQETLQRKDFGKLDEAESEAAARVIMALAQDLGRRLGRRWRSAEKGRRVDLRRSLRASLRHGGEILELRKKRRRPRRTRFVVLCDVSGSMDTYSRFLIQFMYGFQRYVPQVETFVFSTRLTRISPLLRARDRATAFQLVSEKAQDWSGGTRIGSSLAQYNRRYGRRYAGPNTVAILLSDGWDQGELELLEREMKVLKHRVRRLMWLNPLLGLPDYQPIDRGMRTALPHTDEFLDCHDMEQLEAFGRRLEMACSP